MSKLKRRSMPRALQKEQRGVALVLALLIVALVTAITVELTWRFELSTTRAANRWYGVQARAYLLGIEQIAHMALRMDDEEDQKAGLDIDTLAELWAQPPQQFPTDEGWVRGGLEDAQGRFNINTMFAKAPKPKSGRALQDFQKLTEPQRRFMRLLQTVEIEEETFLDRTTAWNITHAVIDWIDRDSLVSDFGGAESDYYAQLDPPVVIANKPMISVSELRVVKGMTAELYKALLPYLVVLPENIAMNVNTMPVKLIRTLNFERDLYPIPLEAAQQVFEQRAAEQIENVQRFQEILEGVIGVGGGSPNDKLNTDGLSVNSNYFIFTGDTMVGDYVRSSKALMFRNGGDVITLLRTDANF